MAEHMNELMPAQYMILSRLYANDLWRDLQETDIHIDYNLFIRNNISDELAVRINSLPLEGARGEVDEPNSDHNTHLLISLNPESRSVDALTLASFLTTLIDITDISIINSLVKLDDMCIIEIPNYSRIKLY